MSYFSSIKLISDYLQLQEENQFDFSPTYHQVAQTFAPWPVAVNEEGIKIKIFEWGLIADYMNTAEKIKQYRSSMANARSEKMLDDPKSVWHRLRQQRCLVFCNGFFEHRDMGAKKKQPYFIRMKDEALCCIAGLYNYAPVPDPATGELIGSFSILTRSANTMMQKIHNGGEHSGRMPLLLNRELALRWLEKTISDQDLRNICDYAMPVDNMIAWPVNSIRKRKEDNEEVIKPINLLFDEIRGEEKKVK